MKLSALKKQKHTIKTQIIANPKTLEIIAIAQAKGKTHDFKLFQNSKPAISKTIKAKLDNGYQGILRLHANSQIPEKKNKPIKDFALKESILNTLTETLKSLKFYLLDIEAEENIMACVFPLFLGFITVSWKVSEQVCFFNFAVVSGLYSLLWLSHLV